MAVLLKRALVSAGLYALAVPGLIAVHASAWEMIGTGCLAGLISATVMS